jgi:hypothetical protein
MAEQDNGNGRITLALLKQQTESVQEELKAAKTLLSEVHDFIQVQGEINAAVKCQLWENGRARLQTVEQCAIGAQVWVKVAIIPIALLVIIELVRLAIAL